MRRDREAEETRRPDWKRPKPKLRTATLANIREEQASGRETFLAAHDVSRETIDRLDCFVALLTEWQRKTNLVAPSTLSDIWTRHIADSLALLRVMPSFRLNADLGSGGGLPGIVLAIARAETGGRVDLVESNGKKAAFLRAAQRECGLTGTVHAARVEDCGALLAEADTVTARALAPLPKLLGLVVSHVKHDARCFFQKGRNHEEEMNAASAQWRFSVVQHDTGVEDGSVVLEIADISPL